MPIPTPKQALRDVFYGNDVFVQTHDASQFQAYEKSQHPSITMLTCCDSRMHQLVFNMDPIDRTFVVQNIGNQVPNAAGSLDYGIVHLKTPLLLIVGHSRCGAIAAAMADYREESTEIIRELNGLHLPILEADKCGDTEIDWLAAAETNVDYQVSLALRRYQTQVDAGTLVVAGCMYDFADLYQSGRGRMILINLNGETELDRLREDSMLKELEGELGDVIVRRKTSGKSTNP